MSSEKKKGIAGYAAAALFIAAGVLYGVSGYRPENTREYPVSAGPVVTENRNGSFREDSNSDIQHSDEVSEPTATEGPLMIDINTAGAEELKRLNGIGDTRANAIIEYRNSSGGFSAIEDIMLVPGIKEGIFNKIKESIYVSTEEEYVKEDSGG